LPKRKRRRQGGKTNCSRKKTPPSKKEKGRTRKGEESCFPKKRNPTLFKEKRGKSREVIPIDKGSLAKKKPHSLRGGKKKHKEKTPETYTGKEFSPEGLASPKEKKTVISSRRESRVKKPPSSRKFFKKLGGRKEGSRCADAILSPFGEEAEKRKNSTRERGSVHPRTGENRQGKGGGCPDE